MIRDEELCRQVQEGSEAAMEALVHRYHQAVFAYLYRLSGNQHLAEDLAQEAFVRLMSRISQYRYPQPFKPWLYTMVHNLFKDTLKSADRRLSQPSADPSLAGIPEPLDLSERIAERALVTEALERLEPAQREVLVLRYYQDLKVDEIAKVTGSPAGTIKSRLHGAIRHLRDLLTRPEGRERHEAARR